MRDYSRELIKTEFYERLSVALSNGIAPLLVTGYAGSGKTAVTSLARARMVFEWKTNFSTSTCKGFSDRLTSFLTCSGSFSE